MPRLAVFTTAVAAGSLLFAWVDPNGVVWDLSYQTSPQRFVSVGSVGLGGPSFDLVMDKLPVEDGSLVRHINTNNGRLEIPITFAYPTQLALVAGIDELRNAFDTGDESGYRPGFLRVTRPDGTVRQLRCLYTGGLEGDTGRGGPAGVTYVVSLTAYDPYATGMADASFSGTFPGVATATVLNAGDLPTAPVWVITGPFTSLVATNLTSGRVWTFGGTIAAGKLLVIDTRSPARGRTITAVDSDNANRFAGLVNNSDLWPLVAGTNQLQLQFSGATVATTVTLTYTQRYRSLFR